MKFNNPLREALYLQRKSIDIIEADVQGLKVNMLCPSNSKLERTALLGSRIWYTPEKFSPCYSPAIWQLIELDFGDLLCVNDDVCIDLFYEGIKNNTINIAGYNFSNNQAGPEINLGESLPGGYRYDFMISDNNSSSYVNIASSTLIDLELQDTKGTKVNIFPEPSYIEGCEDIYALMHARMLGYRAILCCFVLNNDSSGLLISDRFDREYYKLLNKAISIGVEFVCYSAHTEINKISVIKQISPLFIQGLDGLKNF